MSELEKRKEELLNKINSIYLNNPCDKECQTDEELLYNYAWTKYYQHFQQNYASICSQTTSILEAKSTEDTSEKLNSDKIKEIAQNTLQSSGFVYDDKVGQYYDVQNALHYEQDKKLYVDYQNGIYYHFVLNETTNSYNLRYHSKMKSKVWKRYLRLKHKTDFSERNNKSNEVETKENEISKEGENDEESSETESKPETEMEYENSAYSYPPCIRAILIESSTNENDRESNRNRLGNLFIVPYTGGYVGNSSLNKKNNCVIDLIDEKEVEELHAKIEYDMKEKLFKIKDENSKHGTYINEVKLENSEKRVIKHGDRLKIGNNVCLLIHIHSGSDSCISCEPGEVMLKLKLEKEKLNNPFLDYKSKEEQRRETMSSIKKKYGLKQNSKLHDKETYVDRAKNRRNEVGIDTAHISVAQTATTSGLALKMMKKMGWSEGKGLGKTETGIKEPIQVRMKIDKSGLGNEDSEVPISLLEGKSNIKVMIDWKKMQNRYKTIAGKSELLNAFNTQEDDDDEEPN